jgi:hypothetical protein
MELPVKYYMRLKLLLGSLVIVIAIMSIFAIYRFKLPDEAGGSIDTYIANGSGGIRGKVCDMHLSDNRLFYTDLWR